MSKEEAHQKLNWLNTEVQNLTASLLKHVASTNTAAASTPTISRLLARRSQMASPKPIALQGDIAANFKRFKNAWKNYVTISGLQNKSTDEQIEALLAAIGEECRRIYAASPITALQRSSPDAVLSAIEWYLVPTANKRYARKMFNLAMQYECETIDEYVQRLRVMAKKCMFVCETLQCKKDMSNEFILDKLCISIRNIKLGAKLCHDQSLTLQSAIDKIKLDEMNDDQLQNLIANTSKLAASFNSNNDI